MLRGLGAGGWVAGPAMLSVLSEGRGLLSLTCAVQVRADVFV